MPFTVSLNPVVVVIGGLDHPERSRRIVERPRVVRIIRSEIGDIGSSEGIRDVRRIAVRCLACSENQRAASKSDERSSNKTPHVSPEKRCGVCSDSFT